MRTYPRGGRVRVTARLPEPLLAEVVEIGTAHRWSQSATIEALVAEAVDARGNAPESGQGGSAAPCRCGETGDPDSEAYSASEGVEAAR